MEAKHKCTTGKVTEQEYKPICFKNLLLSFFTAVSSDSSDIFCAYLKSNKFQNVSASLYAKQTRTKATFRKEYDRMANSINYVQGLTNHIYALDTKPEAWLISVIKVVRTVHLQSHACCLMR